MPGLNDIIRKLTPLLLAAVLGACASPPLTPDKPPENQGDADMQTLQNLLPGAYSNFAQNHDDGPGRPVTDINIRQLKTVGEPVFLFESGPRGLDQPGYEIYWLKLNRQTRRAEFYFTRLREGEVSLPMQDTLARAWQRVVPGCVVPMRYVDDQLTGQTDPGTCLFEHPLEGEKRLIHKLSLGKNTLTIKTELTGPGEPDPGSGVHLELQKHRSFKGWASVRIKTDQQQGDPAQWQLSQVFNTRDDGRVSQLYDQQMVPMGFGLQLARLHRLDGEPPYYLLSVINLKSGQTQAYQWFKPETKNPGLNLDWFQTGLELENELENGPEPQP